MRNLTIKRTKRFVACLGKMKVYIEDPTSEEIQINGIPCRKLGTLKNGEEQTFTIGEEAAKIFVIADKLSKNFCNEFYQLSEGQEDISLTGKNVYNLAVGNPFRFDNNDSEEVLKNRKKNKKKGIIILCISAAIGLILGFIIGFLFSPNHEPQAKVFSDHGISLTLTDEFIQSEMDGYTGCYGSPDVAVYTLEEKFSLSEGAEDYSIVEYGDLIISQNGLSDITLQSTGELHYFEYDFTNPESGKTWQYYSFVYKADDAFWLVQFATLSENAAEYKPLIFDWASSVEFN